MLRDNPYRRFDERAGVELLPDERNDEIGGTSAALVSYGWRELDSLIGRLDHCDAG